MKVTINDEVLYVGWRYAQKKVAYPDLQSKRLVDKTTCFIKDSDGITREVDVIRKYDDPPNREKARFFSLTKLLSTYFPGKENKKIRGCIWNIYRNRKPTPVEKLENHLRTEL